MLRMLRRVRRLDDSTDTAATADSGATLIEVMVSMVIFVIASAAAAYGILGNQHSSLMTQQRVRGANLAQSYLAEVQPGLPLPAGLPVGAGTTTSDGYLVAMSLDPSSDTCTQGLTRSVSVVVQAPEAKAGAAPVARADGIVSC